MYKHLKSLILIIPTLTIGIWEYVRHAFLLPYISMDLGNWLAPLLVYLVTMTLLRKLFALMEQLQEQLQQERAAKAALEEREKVASELHDGIAQSLFLLSVRVDRMEQSHAAPMGELYQSLRKTVHEVNDYVRQAINGLRYPVVPQAQPWMESIQHLIADFRKDTGIAVHLEWELSEERMTVKEKVELYATLREALINVFKHAAAANVWIQGKDAHGPGDGWRCTVADDGQGFVSDPLSKKNGYGLKIIQDRATKMGWTFALGRENGHTVLTINKSDDAAFEHKGVIRAEGR
ncbi:two-component system, NarL family, nitrate/nitrite sensor histidine kinase NarQ [Paenibacillus tianmuensis]|uniref:histidine kinase n=1 Tax=Paenibacillus tianmuensis TaxID=624147 RepID=A0A1G4R9D5_9BACL|nr:histidine kinase [Paenibacillus tianmuensis]SCW53426.1 two-component system, NarL family, nitrate/nitrite sensor histidine kinase NarQ [Paenibacillus tianmuensis]